MYSIHSGYYQKCFICNYTFNITEIWIYNMWHHKSTTNKCSQGYKFQGLCSITQKWLSKPIHFKPLAYPKQQQNKSHMPSKHFTPSIWCNHYIFPCTKSTRVSIKPSRKFLTKYIHFYIILWDECKCHVMLKIHTFSYWKILCIMPIRRHNDLTNSM